MLKSIWKWLAVKEHIIIMIVLVLLFSEIFLIMDKTVGFILYSILIAVILLALSHELYLSDYDKLMIVLMIVPIVRITELFTPLGFFWRILLSYCILLFLSMYYSIRFKLDHGHKKEKLGLLPFAFIIGAILGVLAGDSFNFAKSNIFLLLIPLIAYSEEILFRGMIQNLAKKGYGVIFSILITSALYGIFSLGYGIQYALFAFAASIIICFLYDRTSNIFLTILINLMIHVFLFVIPQV